MESAMAASRRSDPGYIQVSGYITKEIALKFKAQCTMLETNQADALEEALKLWLEKYTKS